MKRKILNILKYISFLGLGVFLVWWSLHQIPAEKWKDFRTAFSTARYWLLVPVFFIISLSHFLRALRWKMLILPMGYNPSLINTFFAVMIGYLANLAIPRLGEVLKCTILSKYEKVPAEKLVGTIVAERAFDILCLILVFLTAFAIQFEEIGHYGIQLLKRLFIGKTGNFDIKKFAILLAIIISVVVIIKILFRRFSDFRLIKAVRNVVKGVWQGIVSVKGLKQKWEFIFASIGIWAMYILGTWLGFNGTVGTEGLSLKIAISSLAFGSLGMIITPGGIGTYAIFIAKVLEKNGIPFYIGFANGTLQWFAQFLIVIFVGFISLGLLPWYNKKLKKHEETGNNTV
ncbi:lysylphosphatidylglycerol synthase transmembrane domain-containing protein [Segetibacter koreensis]|uniref:lysylphosphatidylglycerol synthase transmembrane domain-containing protein n=1 Tax=Segetibacter koreensis TaxID=398037 RepID=UPI00037519BC|nr:lysylphosphatidylglycerol synthase transmembrane domain-containing protein [Segetibacter koreensis]